MTKVKIQAPKPRKPKKLTLIFGGTVATIFLLILIKALISGKDETIKSIKEAEWVPKILKSEPEPAVQIDLSRGPSPLPNVDRVTYARAVIQASGMEHERKRAMQQAKLVADFKKKIHLDITLPVTLDYVDLDLDENVAAILGLGMNGQKSFAIVATDQKVSVGQALDYLKQNADAFPFVRNHDFLPKNALSFTPPESTGLKALQIIPSTVTKSQRGLFAAIAERQDGRGTYVFMMEAPYSEFDKNEDGLEKMLGTVKANP